MNKKSYVGQESEYDFQSGSQFSLLFHLGLRENHKLLDFGCGCLRLGRLAISYLKDGNYTGYDPNSWLFENINVGNSILSNELIFNDKYDYIIAQSIFTHTGVDLLKKYLDLFYELSHMDTICVATFYLSDNGSNEKDGWKYPSCYAYNYNYIKSMSDFHCNQLNWYHPRQTWVIFSKNKKIVDLSKDHIFNGNLLINRYGILDFGKKIIPDSYIR